MDLTHRLTKLCRRGIMSRVDVNRYEVHNWYAIPRKLFDRLASIEHVTTKKTGQPTTRKWFAIFVVEELN